MSSLELALIDLVIADRVLAHIGAVDAYGHVSLRHPVKQDHFLLSCSRAPELVELSDIMELDRGGNVVGADNPEPPPLTLSPLFPSKVLMVSLIAL